MYMVDNIYVYQKKFFFLFYNLFIRTQGFKSGLEENYKHF